LLLAGKALCRAPVVQDFKCHDPNVIVWDARSVSQSKDRLVTELLKGLDGLIDTFHVGSTGVISERSDDLLAGHGDCLLL
jgi:hypothetical protein